VGGARDFQLEHLLGRRRQRPFRLRLHRFGERVSAFLCISTCQVPACGGDINPIEVAFDGAFTSCTDTLLSVIASDAELSALGDDLWEYLCGFGEDRRRLTTKDGAKHAPSPALQLKLPSVQRAVAKAVAAARNLAK